VAKRQGFDFGPSFGETMFAQQSGWPGSPWPEPYLA